MLILIFFSLPSFFINHSEILIHLFFSIEKVKIITYHRMSVHIIIVSQKFCQECLISSFAITLSVSFIHLAVVLFNILLAYTFILYNNVGYLNTLHGMRYNFDIDHVIYMYVKGVFKIKLTKMTLKI